jgi:hypothetical protein
MIKTGLILAFDEADAFMAEQLAPVPLDIIGIHPLDGGRSIEGIDKTIEQLNAPAYTEFARIIHQSGKQIEFELHGHSWLFPKSLYAEHPEWFREDASGKRKADMNMCVSNKEALAYLAGQAEKLAGLLTPDTGKYCWWSDDVGGDCFCHCPECGDLSPSDQYMIWCNTVLSAIRRVDPQAELSYLAYGATMSAPKKIKPHEGIFLEYAPINRDSFIPINNPACEKNAQETAGLTELLEYFGTKDSRVLEYWLDNSRFSQWRKPYRKLQFDTEIMRADAAWYKSLKFETFTSFACCIGKEYQKEYSPVDYAAYANVLL